MRTQHARSIAIGAITLAISHIPFSVAEAQRQPLLLVGYFEFSDFDLKEANKDPLALPVTFTAKGDLLSGTSTSFEEVVLSSAVYAKRGDTIPKGFMVKGTLIQTVPDGDLFRSKKKYVITGTRGLIIGFMYRRDGKKEEEAFRKVWSDTDGTHGFIVYDDRAQPGDVTITKLKAASMNSPSGWAYIPVNITSAMPKTTTSGVHFVGSHKITLDGPIAQPESLFMSPERKLKMERLDVPTERAVLTTLLPKVKGTWRTIVETRLKELQQ